MPLPLACTVRGCGQALVRTGQALVCPRGHSFDVARRGYVNLLQPQDRRSTEAGDRPEALAARSRVLAAGVGREILSRMAAVAAEGLGEDQAVVVDLGCGAGDLLAEVAGLRPIAGVGIDLSTAAAETAARRHAELTWLVANADRRLPLLDASVDLVLSLHGRRNPAECARVLAPGGRLLVAVPAADDLIELRGAVQGAPVERDRVAGVVQEHTGRFVLDGRLVVRERHRVSHDLLVDLLGGTYRGARASAQAAIAGLDELEVTLASEILTLRQESFGA
ncbi:MAG: methyltransferase domain-containing protein [Vicinamibacterales bacterium]